MGYVVRNYITILEVNNINNGLRYLVTLTLMSTILSSWKRVPLFYVFTLRFFTNEFDNCLKLFDMSISGLESAVSSTGWGFDLIGRRKNVICGHSTSKKFFWEKALKSDRAEKQIKNKGASRKNTKNHKECCCVQI